MSPLTHAYRIATERIALTDHGQVRYTLKTPYRDGTTHVIFVPEDFIARLAALVPKPNCGEPSASARQRTLTWAQRLKRVFSIEIETCRRCGGRLRVIASIEDPAVIERILKHLGRDSRAPPELDRTASAGLAVIRPESQLAATIDVADNSLVRARRDRV